MTIGIDLGTTFSLVSRLQHDGKIMLIPDITFKDQNQTPSAIWLGSSLALAGFQAEEKMHVAPDSNLFRFFKRSFGIQEPLAYDLDGNPWHSEALAAILLRKLAFDATSFYGEKITGVVITVPAHFNQNQRKSIEMAASMAEIPLLALLDEPVAAALYYVFKGLLHKQGIYYVYDLGGGTFDATIISYNAQGIYVLAKDGLTDTGGKEFDEKIMSRVTSMMREDMDIATLSAWELLQLRQESEKIKINLSNPQTYFIKHVFSIGSWERQLLFNRLDFEAGIRQLVMKTIEVSRRCFQHAELSPGDVDGVMLVGGSSVIPLVRQMICEEMGFLEHQIHVVNPQEAVASGAAIYANRLDKGVETQSLPPEFRGVTGYFTGIRTIENLENRVGVDVMIAKNLPLPAKASRTYYTQSDQQQFIHLEVAQYLVSEDQSFSIGSIHIGPIEKPKANYTIEVVLEYSATGEIHIQVFDPQTGHEIARTFTNREDEVSFLIAQKQLVRNTKINNLP